MNDGFIYQMFLVLLLKDFYALSTVRGNDGYAGKSFQVVVQGIYSSATSKHRLHVTRADYLSESWELTMTKNNPRTITLNEIIFVEEHQSINRTINFRIDTSVDVYVRVEYLIYNNGSYVLADVHNFIPVSNLGNEYYVISQCHSGDLCVLSISNAGSGDINLNVSLFSVSTNVQVLHGGNSYRVGDTIILKLVSNEVVDLQSLHDLSGTRISGDNKFSVFSGVFASSYRINSYRQLPPITSYGKYFPVKSGDAIEGDLIKILVSKANTQIEISSSEDTLMIPRPGIWVQRVIPSTESSFVFTSKPVLLVQYELESVNSVALPRYESMIIVPPIQQWSVRAKFAVPSNLNDSMASFSPVLFLTHSEYINELLINGKPESFTTSKLIKNSGYKAGDTFLQANDTYMVEGATDEVAIWGYVASSYRFPLYSDLKKLDIACQPSVMEPGDYIDNDCDTYIDEDDCYQDPDGDCAGPQIDNLDYEGREFFATFMYHHGAYMPKVFLQFSTKLQTNVEVKVSTPRSDVWNETFIISAGNGHSISSTSEQLQMSTGSYIKCCGIYIQATGEISVSGMSAHRDTTGSFLILPKDVLDTDYVAFTDCSGGPQPCECAIIACYDNSNIDVLLSTHDPISINFENKTYLKGEILQVVLNKLDVFQIQDESDLTGIRIISDKPIAVFCGGSRPHDDHVIEQIPPISTWGTYFQTPTIPRCDYCKLFLLTSQSNIGVNIFNSSINHTIQPYKQNHYFIQWTGQEQFEIATTKPVLMIFSFMGVAGTGNLRNAIMVVIPPVQQYMETQYVYIPSNPYGPISYSLGFNSLESRDIFIDGNLVNEHWINVTDKDHFMNSTAPFFAFVLGYGKTGSGYPWNFAFPVGMKLNKINQVCVTTYVGSAIDLYDNDCDGKVNEEICEIDRDNGQDPQLSIVAGYKDCSEEIYDATSTTYIRNESTRSSLEISSRSVTEDGGSSNLCTCRCSEINSLTKIDLQIEIEKIKRDLAVDKIKLSSSVRKLTSADDRRTSSRAIGGFAVAVLITVAAFIFLFDLPVIITHITKLKRNVLKCFMK